MKKESNISFLYSIYLYDLILLDFGCLTPVRIDLDGLVPGLGVGVPCGYGYRHTVVPGIQVGKTLDEYGFIPPGAFGNVGTFNVDSFLSLFLFII